MAGVRKVERAGLPQREVRIELDLPRMIALGVAPGEALEAVASEAVNVPAGSVELGAREFNLQTSGDFESIDEIASTVIRSQGNASIRLRDVARVELLDSDLKQITRYDGKRAVLLAVSMQENQDLFAVKAAIDKELVDVVRELPPDITLERGFDQSHNLRHSLGSFTRDFGLAILLVLATLLPLGVRASLVVMFSIPLSLAVGLFILQLTGFTINQLSIVGFVIALGLLVDDSVVVVENVTRYLRQGATPRSAAVKATRQITASVLGCTATLMLAFMPLLALPGGPGSFIRPLPVALLATIGASLLVSLTVVPFLASWLLRPEHEHGNVVFRAVTSLIETAYRPVLARALAHPILTLGFALVALVGSLALVPRIGFSLFPKAGTPQFLVHVTAAYGASLSETDRAARFVEQTLAHEPSVRHYATSVGKDHPQVYYNVSPKHENPNVADVFAEAELTDPPTRAALYRRLREAFAGYAGAKIELEEFANGPPLEAPVAMRLLGEDPVALAEAASMIEHELATLPGARDVGNEGKERRTDLRLDIDRVKAGLLGARVSDIEKTVHLAIAGDVLGSYQDEAADDPYPIRATVAAAREPGSSHPSLSALERLYVPTRTGAPVPLGQLAHISFESTAGTIHHYDTERSITVTAQVEDGYNTERLTSAALSKIAGLHLPDGVRVQAAGERESREESLGGLGIALLVALFGILAILVLEFRTFRSTLIVVSVVPLGVIGGIVALSLTDYTLSFTATIGFIALMGIEVKNSILLVDLTNQLRTEGLTVDDALRQAGEARFMPILLTTCTAIGGLIPLVLEHSSLYSPLALVILGGLVSSTVLTRVVTPVLYKLVTPEVDESTAQENSHVALARVHTLDEQRPMQQLPDVANR